MCFIKCFQWHKTFFAVIDTASKITISSIHWEACWKWFIQTAKIKKIWSHCQPFIWWPAPILCFYLQCWTLVKSPRVRLKVRLVWVKDFTHVITFFVDKLIYFVVFTEALVSLLLCLVKKCPAVCTNNHFVVLMGAYGVTLSTLGRIEK